MAHQILLIDDHPLVGASLQEALRKEGMDVSLAISVADGHERLRHEVFDAILLDLNFPEGSGIDLLNYDDIKENLPWRICLLTGNTDPDELMLAFDAGAVCYIPKGCPFSDLVTAIRALMEWPIQPDEPLVWDSNETRFEKVSEKFQQTTLLSPREREVFMLMREGLQDKEIAHRIDRSIHTVRVQLRSIRRKRGRTRRSEASR